MIIGIWIDSGGGQVAAPVIHGRMLRCG